MTSLNRSGGLSGLHPNSLKNLLMRNNKGNSHTKKDYSITRIAKEMLDLPAEKRWLDAEDKKKGYTWRQAIALKMLRDGVRGKYSELLERLEGKVVQPVDASLQADIIWRIGQGEVDRILEAGKTLGVDKTGPEKDSTPSA